MALISTAEYKAYAGITDSTWDTRLAVLISMTEAALLRYCGRAFEEATYTDAEIDGTGERSLWLPNTPVTAVSAVKIVASDGTTTTLDSTDYRWTAAGEIFRLGSNQWWDDGDGYAFARDNSARWPDPIEPASVLVSYTGGYATIPDDLKGLMYLLVDSAMDQAGENWMLGATGNGVESKTWMTPDLIALRFALLARPWRGSEVNA